jgi:hypothetical protein
MERRLERLIAAEHEEPDAKQIARRTRRRQNELTAFMWYKSLDGTNNAAWRAMRTAVMGRNISGGSRSNNRAGVGDKMLADADSEPAEPESPSKRSRQC